LTLLPDFGKHVAFKLWNDKTVSIIALFNLMIFYYYVKFILRRICHVYFTYLSIIDLFFTYLSIIDLFLTYNIYSLLLCQVYFTYNIYSLLLCHVYFTYLILFFVYEHR